MASGESKPTQLTRGAKRGVIEYFLLFALLLVVTVTAWTLWDNGIVDTVAAFIEGSR